MQPDQNTTWNPGDRPITVSNQLFNCIRVAAMSASAEAASYDVMDNTDDGGASDSDNSNDGYDQGSRTELDSHANMPVVGRYAYIIAEVGKSVEVSPFSPEYEPINVPMVDAAIQYDDPYT